MTVQSTFTNSYFKFCDDVYRHENHRNILILANYNFKGEIFTDESLSLSFRTVQDNEKGIINMIYDHQIIFSPEVEKYEFVNCGYENNVELSLKAYLEKENKRVTSEYLNNFFSKKGWANESDRRN